MSVNLPRVLRLWLYFSKIQLLLLAGKNSDCFFYRFEIISFLFSLLWLLLCLLFWAPASSKLYIFFFVEEKRAVGKNQGVTFNSVWSPLVASSRKTWERKSREEKVKVKNISIEILLIRRINN